MGLKSRVLKFIADSGVGKTAFCNKVEISKTTLYRWLNDEIPISDSIKTRIEMFIEHFNY